VFALPAAGCWLTVASLVKLKEALRAPMRLLQRARRASKPLAHMELHLSLFLGRYAD